MSRRPPYRPRLPPSLPMLALILLPAPVLAAEPLAAVVERLAAGGDPIYFRADVVPGDTPMAAGIDSLPALDSALAHQSLRLERAGEAWIIVRAPQPATAPVSAAPAAREPAELLENVIVTGSRHRLRGRLSSGSVTALDAADLAAPPSLGNDAMRAVVRLPGMATMGVSARPRIRGGLADETLVRLDGVELLDPYHLADFQGIFSVLNDRAVEAVDVYTGGFPARYGNRMSGVMDIAAGLSGRGRRNELGVSLFSVQAYAQGTMNRGATDYQASIRRSTLDRITRQFEPELGEPRYYDAFARLEHELTPAARLSAGALSTKDDVVLLDEDETFAQSDIDSRYLWSRLDLDHGRNLSSRHVLSYTWSSRRKKLTDADDDSTAGGFLEYLQQLRKVSARSAYRLALEQTQLEFGAELEYGRTRYQSTSLVNRGPLGSILGTGTIAAHDIDTAPEGFAGGAYLSADIPVTDALMLQPGIRWDVQTYDPRGRREQISPRLGLRLQPAATVSLHVAVGRFYQPEALHELPAADGVTDYAPPQSADHLIAGIDWLGPDGWEIGAELYEKRYDRPKRRFENLFNPFVLVPELEADRIALAPDRARARGADLEIARQITARLRAALHYGYMDAEDEFEGHWVPRRWSQRHSASATVAWQGEHVSAAVSLAWHSGWRGARLPGVLPAGGVLDVEALLSNTELRNYLSLDASIRRRWQIGRSEFTVFASITNLTNRDNLAGIEYDAAPGTAGLLLDAEREYLMPLVPSLGVVLAF